jgi:hypothetical protein
METNRLRYDRKEAGNYQLNKLRTIHLFKADYNWLLGMSFCRRMVHGAEKQDHLHEGQWGSRPGRSAHDALLHKILTYEVARMTRTPLATFDNDAKSCYDRIIMVFVLMLCQKHGVPQSVCMMAAMSLMMAEHSIKTKYGVSSATYSSTDETRLTAQVRAVAWHQPFGSSSAASSLKP